MVSSLTVEVCDKNVPIPKLIKSTAFHMKRNPKYIMKSLKVNGIYQVTFCHDDNGNAQIHVSYLITRR
jgi:hypothetical protein